MQNMRVLFLLLISSVCVAQENYQNLFTVVSKGTIEDVRTLLNSGVDVNVQDVSGATALFYAVSYGRLDCVKLLLEKGANPTLRDQDRCTPLLLAEFNADYYGNKAEAIDVLRSAASLFQVAEAKQLDCLEFYDRWTPEQVNLFYSAIALYNKNRR